MKNGRRRTQNINGGALEDTRGESGKWRGRGIGILTLRGNEKWEEKNSKYQWWGIGNGKRSGRKGNGKGKGSGKWRGRGEWDYYFER